MSIIADHAGITAAAPQASARFLAAILAEGGVTPEGPDGEMARPGVGDGALTWFALAAHQPHHVPFKVTATVPRGAISRLRQRGAPFGDDPGNPGSGRTDDPLGGAARICFHDASGHLSGLFVPAGQAR